MEEAEVIQKTVLDYDQAGDVLYISFGGPQPADDSDITDEGGGHQAKRRENNRIHHS